MKEKFVLLLLSLSLTVGFAEIALRLAGFSYRLYPEKIEFGFPDPKRMSSSHQPGKEPQYLKQRFLKDLTKLVPLHQSYVNAVRNLATSTHTALCDLEKSFKKLPAEDVSKIYFTSDGIHLTPKDHEVLAGYLYDCLKQQNLI